MGATHRVSAYRDRMRARGLRPVQRWVPDVHSANFARDAATQSQRVADADAHTDDQDFIEAVSSSWDDE